MTVALIFITSPRDASTLKHAHTHKTDTFAYTVFCALCTLMAQRITHKNHTPGDCESHSAKALTGYLERRIPAGHRTGDVSRHAPIDAAVLLLFAVHGAQKEQRPGRQQDTMRLIVAGTRAHRFAVFVPLDGGLRFAVRLAVERDRFVLRHHDVAGMLGDARHSILGCLRSGWVGGLGVGVVERGERE